MNKIIREHYPASKLPDDLRGAVPPQATVRVTVETEDAPSRKSLRQIMRDIEEARRSGKWPATTTEEGVARIRALRDEWDD
jgi:hypothetical protein